MHESINEFNSSVMFGLCYDLHSHSKISENLISFVEKKLKKKWKIGAISLNPDTSVMMEIIGRDLPSRDLEYFILTCKDDILRESIYDVLIQSCYKFPEDHTKRFIVAIINEYTFENSAKIKDLQTIIERDIKLVIISPAGAISSALQDFINGSSAELIQYGNETNGFMNALNTFYSLAKN